MDLHTHHSTLNEKRVIKYVGKWIKSKFGRIPFAIAGSYAAAIAAHKHDPSFRMKFNDIDVYIKHHRPGHHRDWWDTVDENYEEGAIPNLVSESKEQNVIPGSTIEVNLISLDVDEGEFVSLEGLIGNFDTNATMVGFVTTYSKTHKKYRIHHWHEDINFWLFLHSRTLKVPNFTDLARPASAFVRLLYKAQQLKLNYELPEESKLLDTLDGRCMGEPTKAKLEKLKRRYKREFTNRFLIADSFFSRRIKQRLYKLGRI